MNVVYVYDMIAIFSDHKMKYLQHLSSQRNFYQEVLQVQAISLVRDWNDSLHNNQLCTHHVRDQNQQLLQLNSYLACINNMYQ